MSIYRRMLRLGGYLNLAIAAAHLAVMVALKPVLGAFGSPAWVERMLAEGWTGWARLYMMIVAVAAFATVLGLYGLSGGGRIRRLPFLRTGLLLTSAIFVGDFINMGWLQYTRAGWQGLARPSVAPFVLCIGLLYLVGTIGLWKELGPPRRRAHAPEVLEA